MIENKSLKYQVYVDTLKSFKPIGCQGAAVGLQGSICLVHKVLE